MAEWIGYSIFILLAVSPVHILAQDQKLSLPGQRIQQADQRQRHVPLSTNMQSNQMQEQARPLEEKSAIVYKPPKLAEHPDCADDVQKYCKKSSNTNFAVVECLQNDLQDDDEISLGCQHVLWQYRKNLTSDLRYETAIRSVCQNDLNNISECANLQSGQGLIMSCLISYIESVSNANCREFLRRMGTIIFSNYRMIYKFVEHCENDINDLNCGRVEPGDRDELDENGDEAQGVKKPHDQGKTVACLAEKAEKLTPPCRLQLLRVAELQADDYHSDRQLYFACRDDRERFCPRVISGGGNVYKCLYRYKFDSRMSSECRKRLAIRQKLQHEDYKVNRGFAVACRTDIAERNCNHALQSSAESQMVGMAVVLLCLEGASRQEKAEKAEKLKPLEPECVAELKELRRSLLEDYEISPEVAKSCQNEIQEQCREAPHRQMIHCLMDLARKSKLPRRSGKKRMSPECFIELNRVVEEAEIDEDYSVDPSLEEACSPIARTECADIQPGEGRIYACLMLLVSNARVMTPNCKEKLMEVQYFISRSFNLSPMLLGKCTNVIKQGKCPIGKEENNDESMKQRQQAETLLCLYRQVNNGKDGNDECASEVKRVMMDRATSVDLDPEVEDACISELGQFCSSKTDKNEEMDCLEDNLEVLGSDCKKVVSDYTERNDEMPELNTIFANACQKFWKTYCKEAAESGKDDNEAGSLMSCLIENKFHEEMDEKCRAGIVHHQLITMKDYKLSRAFKEACRDNVQKDCQRKTKKAEVIECLSSMVRNDTLLEAPHRVTPECRTQLTFELLQRSENINLDQTLSSACTEDAKQFCSNVSPGKSAVIECLRKNQANLKSDCHNLLFKREQEEAEDPTTDFSLMTKCKKMIKKYCADNYSPDKRDTLLSCLVKHKEEEETFDQRCAKVLILRERVQAKDIRLNPELMKNCKKDIGDHCKNELKAVRQKQSEGEGQVLFCLRKQFALKMLQTACKNHVASVIKESVLDYVQDVRLVQHCSHEIKEMCADAVEADKNDESGGRGEVVECLRQHLLLKQDAMKINKQCLQQIARVLDENKADVHLDPVLFRACILDLKGVCKDVPRGDGRQMSCLLSNLQHDSEKLRSECKTELENRVKLWEASAQMAGPENLSELVSQVVISDSRTYLLLVIMTVVLFIFASGLCCGRVTKRVAQQVKSK